MAASNGNCFICGKTAGKTAIKNHVLKEHNSGDEPCYLIRAEGAYDKDFWILFNVAQDATLRAIDNFLRAIWCECCGHLSSFSANKYEIGMTRKVSALSIGDSLLYEYDFGSTTKIVVTVLDGISRMKQREKVQFLARNVPPDDLCNQCGEPATLLDAWEFEILCEKCAEDAEDEDAFLPIVNSPRCGVCGYDGEFDIWIFDQNKPFPQPQKTKQKRGMYMSEEEKIPAVDKWNTISVANQRMILENVLCGKCIVTTITDYTIEDLYPDIVLEGKCSKCGGKVARVVEF